MARKSRHGKEERRQPFGKHQGIKKTIIDMSNILRGSRDARDILGIKFKEKDKGETT